MKTKKESGFKTFNMLVGEAAIPSRDRNKINLKMELAGIDVKPYEIYSVCAYIVLAVSLVAASVVSYLMAGFSSPIATVTLAVVLFFLFFIFFLILGRVLLRIIINTRIAYRVQAMEDALPDFLAEVSLNLKSGQSLHKSLAKASEEEFGVLSEEMARVATRVRLGYDLEEALRDFMENFPSEVLSESFELIILSWRKGASSPKLIDRIVSNMKIMRNMREKISASVANYRIFLTTITVLVAPAMLALSYHVIDLIRNITTEVREVTSSSTLPFNIVAVMFNDTHFIWFSALALLIIVTFSSLIITYIESGSVKRGGKQLFIYMVCSLGSYFLFLSLFTIFFRLFQV